MSTPVAVPELVRQRAMSNGAAGRRWLDQLPDVVSALAARWDLTIGTAMAGGTAGYVTEATDGAGRACVLKVAMPLDDDDLDAFRRAVLVHGLAAGRGCAELYDFDDTAPAMLLERLGPNLHDLDMSIESVLEVARRCL
jgi:streptomycin 6-kinase